MITNNKILIWMVVLLLILNIVTIATILYHNHQEKTLNDESVIINTEGQMLNGMYLRQRLGFNDSQIAAFREANHGFRPQALTIINRIDSLKEAMFAEMRQDVSDTTKLDQLSQEIGSCHSQLKKGTYKYYLKIRAICSREQRPQFEKIFAPLFEKEALYMPQGRGRKQGRGGRWQQQKISNN
jgi:hypothetical protein